VEKISLQEYAELKKISLVTVNKHIKNNIVESIKEKNRRYILIDRNEVVTKKDTININSLDTNIESIYKERIKDLKIMNKQLIKQNKQLNKDNKLLFNDLKNATDESKNVYKQFISEMKNIAIPHKKKEKKKKKK